VCLSGDPKTVDNLCAGLGEVPNSFSEPDVIVDFGEAGLMFIEVKHRRGNDLKRAGLSWLVEIRVGGSTSLADRGSKSIGLL
jgi:hypothetical protein